MKPRILVTGSRGIVGMPAAEKLIRETLEVVRSQEFFADAVLVHGMCYGADAIAAKAWRELGGVEEPHPARWGVCSRDCKPAHRKRNLHGGTYCPTAGRRRNTEMVELGADLCLAFIYQHSPGATHCADSAEAAGIHTERIEVKA